LRITLNNAASRMQRQTDKQLSRADHTASNSMTG